MLHEYQSQVTALKELIFTKFKQHEASKKEQGAKVQRFMVGVCGVPGSGKSTLCQNLKQQCSEFTVLPMDGFHLPRSKLDEEGLRRRGAPHTFDLQKFSSKLKQIKQNNSNQEIFYPDFDHAVKDPAEDAIIIPANSKIIIVEGIYIFTPQIDIETNADFWDVKVWMDTSRQLAEKRGALRHLQCRIANSIEQAYQRSQGSDRMNADYVIQNCYNKSIRMTLEDPNNKQSVFIFKNDDEFIQS